MRAVAARQRFWEIDCVRGCSVALMVGFHSVYDLFTLSVGAAGLGRDIPQLRLPVYLIWQHGTAILFLLLAGVSLTLGGTRHEKRRGYPSLLIRGAKIFAWGLAITLLTRLVLGRGYVVFGILHLIGLSVALSYPFLNRAAWNLGWGALAIGAGIFLSRLDFSFPWLVWAGFVPPDFFSVDFFPFFPWFGFILWGIWIGNLCYANGRRRWRLAEKAPPGLGWLCFLGRNSLAVYLIHQPALLMLWMLWRAVKF